MEEGGATGAYEDFMTGFVVNDETVWGRRPESRWRAMIGHEASLTPPSKKASASDERLFPSASATHLGGTLRNVECSG